MPKHRSASAGRQASPRKVAKRPPPKRLDDWLRFNDACKQIFEKVKGWDLVLSEVRPLLKSGKIRSFIRIYKLGDTDNYQDFDLRPTFWKENKIVRRDDGFGIAWPDWADTRWPTWLDEAKPKWWPADRFHYMQYVFLKRTTVNRHWPTRPSPRISGWAETGENNRSKPGPKPKYEWKELVAAHVIRLTFHMKEFPTSISPMLVELAQLCEDEFRWQPDPADLHKFVTKLLEPLYKSLE